jgi:hypothetical protein
LNNEITEVDFSFDNYGSGFIVDNVKIVDLENLGTNENLNIDAAGIITAYGYGFYADTQQLMDRIYRIAPHITYNLSNFKLGFEYELTSADYGKIQGNGRIENSSAATNHRAMATISYIF